MNILFLGMTAGVIGKAMLAYGVIIVHIKMAKERRIDEEVIESFRVELIVTLAGVALIVTGYLLELIALGGVEFVNCSGLACGAALNGYLNF